MQNLTQPFYLRRCFNDFGYSRIMLNINLNNKGDLKQATINKLESFNFDISQFKFIEVWDELYTPFEIILSENNNINSIVNKGEGLL